MTAEGGTPEHGLRVERAYDRAREAYLAARSVVYDHLPPGALLDELDLTEAQRALVQEHRTAEEALHALRGRQAPEA